MNIQDIRFYANGGPSRLQVLVNGQWINVRYEEGPLGGF